MKTLMILFAIDIIIAVFYVVCEVLDTFFGIDNVIVYFGKIISFSITFLLAGAILIIAHFV